MVHRLQQSDKKPFCEGCCGRIVTLSRAYQRDWVPQVQYAFKKSMIHQILQFILHYRSLLRSSSLREPRDPSLKGVFGCLCCKDWSGRHQCPRVRVKKKKKGGGAKINWPAPPHTYFAIGMPSLSGHYKPSRGLRVGRT